jgi:signal peptidase I
MRRYGVLLALLALAACSGGSDATPTPTTDVVERFTVEGASMEPKFSNGDVLDVLRYTAPVATGDIVVFHAPTSPNREFVKRVIAGPGQSVRIDDDAVRIEVRVDDQPLNEPYVKGVTDCPSGPGSGCTFLVPHNPQPAIPVPDSSPISIPIDELGRLDALPCKTTACYFVLGDNRQNSSDSRQGWLVPVDNIIGYVESPHP